MLAREVPHAGEVMADIPSVLMEGGCRRPLDYASQLHPARINSVPSKKWLQKPSSHRKGARAVKFEKTRRGRVHPHIAKPSQCRADIFQPRPDLCLESTVTTSLYAQNTIRSASHVGASRVMTRNNVNRNMPSAEQLLRKESGTGRHGFMGAGWGVYLACVKLSSPGRVIIWLFSTRTSVNFLP
jgi:hypothetical protein